jgi:signal transduction histidine kinase
MDPGYIHLAVQDNGIGLVSGEDLDLAHLLAEQHFGLAGMHERAAIINADLNINSSPGAGTTISIAWRDNGKGSNFTVI